jgi:hypothetical protein
MLALVRPEVQGVQVSAPFGRVDYALQVLEEVGVGAAAPA